MIEMNTFEVKEKCQSCKGTGLYHGIAEREGAAVVCHKCKGTGCHTFVHEYEVFTHRVESRGIERVYETNPGICIGAGNGHTLEEFGGMPIKEWESGLPFKAGMENRKYTCPCWWYQSTNYKLKPEWDECNRNLGRTFSQCDYFPTKDACWDKWDKEQK